MPTIFNEKITVETDYFIAIDFLAYCIRSENEKLFNMVYKIIEKKILDSKDYKIYNLVIILFTALDSVNIRYYSKEKHISKDISVMLSEKLMSYGIADKIFTVLSKHKECDFSLPEIYEETSLKNSYDRSSIIAWNQIVGSNKISYIYSFISTIYGKFNDDVLVENGESDEDFWDNESHDHYNSESYFDDREEIVPEADDITILNSSFSSENTIDEVTYEIEKYKPFNSIFFTLFITEKEFEILENSFNIFNFVKIIKNDFEKEFKIENINDFIKIKKDDLEKVGIIVDSKESNFEDQLSLSNQSEEIEELEFSDESSIGEENGIIPNKNIEEINNMDEESLSRFLDEWYENRKMNSVNYKPIDKIFFNQLSELGKQLFAEHERRLKDDYFQYAPSCESSMSLENEEKDLPEDIEMYADVKIFMKFLKSYLTSNYTNQFSLNEFIEVASFNLEWKHQIISLVMDAFLNYSY